MNATIIAQKTPMMQVKPASIASRVDLTVTDEGILTNSKPMSLNLALALVKELTALHIHVESVDCRKGIVSYRIQPSSEFNLNAFRAHRIATAYAQVEKMSFYGIEMEGGREMVIAINDDMHGGISHTMDAIHGECDCEDYQYRCMKHGEQCHHLHALRVYLALGGVVVCAPVQQSQPEPEPGDLTREPFYDDEPETVRKARQARLKAAGRDF